MEYPIEDRGASGTWFGTPTHPRRCMASMNSRTTSPLIGDRRPISRATCLVGRTCLMLLALVMLLLTSGCKEEKIDHYRVPKDRKPAQRLLGAIVLHGERVWFFKLLGPQAAVDQ